MINALRAETRRLLSRRIVISSLIALLGLIVLFQLQVSSSLTPPSAAEVAQVQQEYQESVKDWEDNHEEWEADCLDSGASAQDCAMPRPTPADWGLGPIPFDDAVTPAISFGVFLGGMLLFIAMASFIGAEAGSGSLANWLTFVPNRTTVMVSKLAVVAAFSVLTGAAVGVLTVAASSVLAAVHRQPLTGFDDVAATAARGIVVLAIFGIAGYTVGLLTASSGASIGILLGGFFLTYLIAVLSFASRWAQLLAPFSPGLNLAAILTNGTTYEVSAGPSAPLTEDGESYVTKTLSLAHGLGYWAVLLAVLLVVTWYVFRRRDVS